MEKEISFEYKVSLFIFIAFFVRLALLYTTGIELYTDEAYYYIWSKHLAWSYYDHPPMIAYLIALSNVFVSNKELAVKLVPMLLFSGTSIYVYLLGKEFFDKKTAFYSMILVTIIPLSLGESIIATPDAPMIFFMTGASYYFYLAVKKGSIKLWITASIFVGASLLSKYIAFLIYPSFFLYLILPENRSYFKKKIPYISIFLSLLFFLPVVLWNYFLGWRSFRFQLDHGFNEGSLPNWYSIGDFLGSQMMIFAPILFIFFIIFTIYMLKNWKECLIEEKYLWCLAGVHFYFFFLCSIQKKVEGNWPAYAYIPGTLLVVIIYERVFKHKKVFRKLWVANWIYCWSLAILAIIVINIPFVPAKIQKFGDFYGWKQLDKPIKKIMKENPGSILAAGHYAIASEIEAYSGEKVGCVVSGGAKQYSIWVPNSFTSPHTYIYCTTSKLNNSNGKLIKIIPIKYANKIIRNFYIYKISTPHSG